MANSTSTPGLRIKGFDRWSKIGGQHGNFVPTPRQSARNSLYLGRWSTFVEVGVIALGRFQDTHQTSVLRLQPSSVDGAAFPSLRTFAKTFAFLCVEIVVQSELAQ